MTRRPLIWLLAALLALPAAAAAWLAVYGWDWARGPLQDLALRKTGRELRIGGSLGLAWGWPAPRVRATDLSFANPAWASAPQMIKADAVDVSVDLPELLRGRLVFPEVRLTRPQVWLEQASGGRRNWLLDAAQTDEEVRIPIGRVLLDRGELHYTDRAQKTEVLAELSTLDAPAAAASAGHALSFKAGGRFRGLPLAAQGSGGAVLAWRDEAQPYPLQFQATLGRTVVQAEGTVTSLLKFTAVDLQLALRGDNLAALSPLIGIALPPTPAYRSSGRLLRKGSLWRYERFAGQVGKSDLAGSLQVESAGARPLLSGALASRRLDLADLAPAAGVRAEKSSRVLPDLPFDTASWASLDAAVTLSAQTLLRDKALPLEKLHLVLTLKDQRLALDPLSFGMAGGQMKASLKLDGQAKPLRGHLVAQLRGVMLGRLFQALELGDNNAGRLDGDIDLVGQGASIGRMLAGADGRVNLVAQNGRVSRLLMEKMGLHLLEILRLNLTGDRVVDMNCLVADFDVAKGSMKTRALLLDSSVNTLVGSGRIDLDHESLDITLMPHTKVASLVALRSPIHLVGSFAQPRVEVDTGRVALRGAGALALGLINPLLALIPLFEPGPGVDAACTSLLRDARTASPKARP